jgi:hypothetical protein
VALVIIPFFTAIGTDPCQAIDRTIGKQGSEKIDNPEDANQSRSQRVANNVQIDKAEIDATHADQQPHYPIYRMQVAFKKHVALLLIYFWILRESPFTRAGPFAGNQCGQYSFLLIDAVKGAL